MNKKIAHQYEASVTAYNDVYYKRDLVMRIKSELNDLFKLLTKEKSHRNFDKFQLVDASNPRRWQVKTKKVVGR